MPEDLKVCFDTTVPAPQQEYMTSKDMVLLVAALKASETEKSLCGKRLLNWIETTLG